MGWLRRHLDVLVFGASLLILAFGYGVAVGKLRVFPHDILNSAFDAATDWRENWRHFLGIQSKWLQPSERTEPVSWRAPERSWPGLTFVTGYDEGVMQAMLVDMQGNVRHRWPFSIPAMWEAAEMPGEPFAEIELSIHGAVLFPDGHVILSIGGGALTKLDRCGNVVYAVDLDSHHSVDLLPDGSVLTLGQWVVEENRDDRPRMRPGPSGYYLDDTLAHVSATGEVLREESLIDILHQSDLASLLLLGGGSSYTSAVTDPLHANDAELLTAALAPAFPMFEAGDILVSLRNIATLAVLDGESWRVKWYTTGPFLGQHDPDFTADGTIMVYDNKITGERPRLGYSRVIEIDPRTHEIVWQYEGTDADPMYSSLGGRVQMLPNGNVLALEPQGGRIIEIARGNGDDVVWEFVNIEDAEEGLVGMLFDGIRFAEDELSFLGRPCP